MRSFIITVQEISDSAITIFQAVGEDENCRKLHAKNSASTLLAIIEIPLSSWRLSSLLARFSRLFRTPFHLASPFRCSMMMGQSIYSVCRKFWHNLMIYLRHRQQKSTVFASSPSIHDRPLGGKTMCWMRQGRLACQDLEKVRAVAIRFNRLTL